MPRELKHEDVMRAFDILDKMAFFQGQRAGRELWNDKPYEVQEQDIADFSQGIATVKKVIEEAISLHREKDAEIERLNAKINIDGVAYKDLQELYDADVKSLSENIEALMETLEATRSEAINEFAEKAKRRLPIVSPVVFDQIVNELKGGAG